MAVASKYRRHSVITRHQLQSLRRMTSHSTQNANASWDAPRDAVRCAHKTAVGDHCMLKTLKLEYDAELCSVVVLGLGLEGRVLVGLNLKYFLLIFI